MDASAIAGRYRDQILAAGLAAFYALEVLFSSEVEHHRGSAAAVAVLMAVSLVVRLTMPLLPLVAVIAVIQLNHTVLPGLAEGGAFMIALIVTIFSAGHYLHGRMLALGGVIVAGIIPLAALDPRQPPAVGDWIFFIVYLGTPFVAGVVFRRRRERDREMTEMARRAEEEGETRAGEAVAAERARIARELHDVVAHAISVIVVQARGGRRVLADDTGGARSAFDVIEHAGEQALTEMRRLLALLRETEPEAAALQPQPSLGRIDVLATEVAASGLPVEVVREGDPVELPPGVDLSAYRIVQEALTNALKHAGPARARVVLRYLPRAFEVEVLDDGHGTGAGGGSGHGLTGVRERVEVYGGQLSAGTRPEGGFAVRARLPIEIPS
ncbi:MULTISPECIES: histidine kinase [unclassified Nocardioides]|uniref:sensor histidine kinase n=1 Tax=unclassified Nocardioides TaxID=2615069 RepID=UPI00005712A9|nr:MULTISPECIES: histidine kinase [unclassified Nocardioides]ABL79483.1 histidine kinase, dimerisation and phosphoacceptor region [Nocardioides sp. JS614]